MKYLAGAAQASVAILYPTCRWLSGRDRAAYDVMDAALRPEHLVGGEGDALLAALRVGRDIGLLDRLGNTRTSDQAADWALSEPARSQRDEWYADPVRFRVLVRRALLAKAVDDITAGATPSDVAVGLAWLLAQDPVRPLLRAYGDGPERALNDQKLDSYITGPAQWRPFLRWAVALGCAEFSQVGNRRLVLPDPTAALAEELPPIQPAGLPARDFYAAVTRELPVLDGGRISDFMRAERAECADPRGDAMIGPAFSLALRRLHGQGVIDLRREADAGYRVNGVLHGQRWTFDRVMRRGENGDD
ncbi:MAG TPA: protein DpdG [Streptosporangiaceae bacterium]|nr:protein DpdG [Streptosporangiaceae bacterium]